MSADDPVLTVRQLAERHGLSRDVIYTWMRRHGLPQVKPGDYRVRISDFERWWSEMRTTGEVQR